MSAAMQPLASMTLAVRAAMRGVLADIDDTLSTGGRITAESYAAMENLRAAGLLVIPIVTLVSFAFAHPLALAFRPIELTAMGAAAVFVAFVIRDGRARRWEGALLISLYAAFAVSCLILGDR